MEEEGCRWYLFGAQAVNVWGTPRLTNDVDVTAEIPENGSPDAIRALARHGFRLRFDADDDFIRRARVIPLVHESTDLPLDLVLAGPGFEEDFLARAAIVSVDGVDVPVITPEDLVVTKVLAGRPKDLEDVRGILRVRGDALDLGRVRRLLALLEAALGQSDLVPAFEELWAETR